MVQVINKIIKRSINNVRIKYKFMLFFGIVLFIFIGFTTYFLFTKSYLYIVEKKNETYIQHIEQSKQNIDFTLKSYEKILNTLFLNKSFRESLVQNFESIPEQIDFQRWMYNYLDSLTIDYEPLPMIKIYSGNESLKVDNQMFFLMEDLQSTEWYKITNKRPERIKIHRWLNTIKSRRHEKDFYYICGLVEIFDDYTKRKVAVVTIEIDVEQLFSFLDLAESTIIIVDSEGQVIYSTNRDIITSNISSNEYFSKIKKMKKGSFILSNVENSDMIFFDNIAGTDCDAIMLEINDPAYHLEYFEKAVKLGKPIFLDKPMADTYTSGKAIYDIAKENNAKVFSASSLRFVTAVVEAKKEISKPEFVSVYGALGIAPAGSSVVWYGVHTMEMLQKLMGPGAVSLKAIQDGKGVVCVVKYKNGGRGVAELNTGSYIYGGMVRTIEKSYPFSVDMSMAYTLELEEVASFFKGEEPSVSIEDTLEVMDLLDTAQRSLDSGKEENLNGSY
jgi:hypothetical protein